MKFRKDRMWSAMFPPPSVSVSSERELPALTPEQASAITASLGAGQVRSGNFDGDKWSGAFGPTELLTADYWTLRARSVQLFETNLFARGLVRRLVTNEINSGLNLEASPMESIIGLEQDSLEEWGEGVENLFELWGSNSAKTADALRLMTWGELQQQARIEALVSGDYLVTLQQDPVTRLPRVRLLPGERVQSPLLGAPQLARGNTITLGVERDSAGRHVAYWVAQDDMSSKRIPAWGEKSGRRIAWLVYGTDKRSEDVRGKPLLSIVLQALRDLDRYRDATLRKAVINSIVAMFVERKEKELSGLPITSGGAIRKGVVADAATGTQPRRWNAVEAVPGLIVEDLAAGETIKPGSNQGTDEKYSEFQDAVLAGIAMAYEVPPEILTLKFSSNYSASRAALNEFDNYLFKVRTSFGANFCAPIYVEWITSAVLSGLIEAPGLLEAWMDPKRQHVFHAWTFSEWNGHVKASVDPLKMMNGYEKALSLGVITRDRVAREVTGMKYTRVVRRLRKENEQAAEALEPLKELEEKPAQDYRSAPSRNSQKPNDSTSTEGDDDEGDREPADDE